MVCREKWTFFLYWGVKIINNSWSFTDPANNEWMQKYNYYSRYVDELIQSNPEIINVFSAGNTFSGNKNENPHKEIAGVALSKNSILVGAINYDNDQAKTDYSQIGNNINYVTAVAYGGTYNFSSWNNNEDGFIDSVTSFSAPVITALSSMIVQRNKYYFDKGHDSIIMKSALIFGSKNPIIQTKFILKKPDLEFRNFIVLIEQLKILNISKSRFNLVSKN